MATTDRFAIKQLIVDLYGLGRSGFNDEATGTTAILSDDSQFGGHRGADRIEVGCDLLAKQDATVGGGGAVTYDAARISKRPSFAAGQITVDPLLALGETPDKDDNDTDFLVLYLPFRNEQFNFEIDDVLDTHFLWQKLIRPLTVVADGDMRATAEADWTLNNATDAKAAATFPFGERIIVVSATSAAGYTSTGNIAVEELKTYYLEATGLIDPTLGSAGMSGELRLIDVTNSNTIAIDNSVIDRFEPEILANSVQMPSGCEQVDIRLISDANSDDIAWTNVIFRKDEQLTFTLQDKPYRIQDIGEVRATSERTWGRRAFEDMQHISREVVQISDGLWQIQLKQNVSGMAVFYEEWVAPGILANDSSTTIAPKEDVAAVVAERLLLPYHEDKYWRPFYTKAALKAAKVIQRAQGQRSYVNRSQRVQRMQRV